MTPEDVTIAVEGFRVAHEAKGHTPTSRVGYCAESDGISATFCKDGIWLAHIDTLAAVLTERHIAAEGFCGESHMADAEDIVRRYAARACQSAQEDAILAATQEACRDAVTDATNRLIVAFSRFCVDEFGYAPTAEDFRDMLHRATP